MNKYIFLYSKTGVKVYETIEAPDMKTAVKLFLKMKVADGLVDAISFIVSKVIE